ncbi:MAG: AAA family ATPase, partial [Oscillospiraceae bacterium]|nr:AAA family ATPase [Oscillospiraceae bacterium]
MMCSKCGKRPAMFFITKLEGDKTINEGLCMKCAMEMNIGPIKQIMQSMGISEDEVDSVSEQFEDLFGEDGTGFMPGGAGTLPFMNQMGETDDELDEYSDDEEDGDSSAQSQQIPVIDGSDSADRKKKDKKNKRKGRKFLSLYCTDLTAKAREGGIDRIIGRDNEIYRTVQILCRRSKNNPCLIGEPGVGKTAIAEGLALRIANGDVPAKLANKEIHLLDLTALVAGTQFRGQFESRIKGLIDEVKHEGNIILFIDEVHNLVGTGDAEGSMNAANILKPALSRGEIQIIGATTFTEYRKYIEKDAALERRLQPIKVEEPSIEETYQMLVGIKDYYENFHKVSISDSLVHRAVVLSERYINDRFLPDKAIDLLDEACTCANLRNKSISDLELAEDSLKLLNARQQEMMDDTENTDYEGLFKVKSEIAAKEKDIEGLRVLAADNAVTEEDLARVIQLWTGIPSQKIMESDLTRLADMEAHLKA